jgi:hypothetical protein
MKRWGVPLVLAIIFIIWGAIDEFTGNAPSDQIFFAALFGIWAAVAAL